MANHINKLVFIVVLCGLMSCGSNQPPRYVTAALPAPSGDGTCATEPSEAKPFTMCDRYHMADAYFVGEIVGLDPLYSPAFAYKTGVQDTCGDSAVSPGGVFRIRPIRWLSGAPGDPAAEIRVHIGGDILDDWGTFQSTGSGATGFTSGELDTKPLFAVGSVVGGALVRVEAPLLDGSYVGADGRVWGLPEPLFTVYSDGRILDPQASKGECAKRYPDIEGLTMDELAAALAQCEGVQPSAEAKSIYEGRVGAPDPQSFYAARCSNPEILPTSRACDESTLCRIGFCESNYCECHGAEICESYWKKLGL